jgi:hypothetical protein
VCQIEHTTAQCSRAEDKRREAGQKSERIEAVKRLAKVLLDALDIGPRSGIEIRISLCSVRWG